MNMKIILALHLFLAPWAIGATQTATLAGGCFWGMEEYFRKMPGVLETQVGYTGGDRKNPSYEDVCTGTTGHAESVEIKFDDSKLAYRDILIAFFKMHDPTTPNRQGNDEGTQYRSAIFYQDAAQKKIAEDLVKKIEKSNAWKAKLVTQIAPAKNFYPAEKYHQKYLQVHVGGYDNHKVRDLKFE